MTLPSQERFVLVVDDESDVRAALKRLLREAGLRILEANGAAAAMELLESIAQTPQVVISDLNMPETDGISFLENVKSKFPETQRILLTGFADTVALERAINGCGIYRFLSKPWDDTTLLRTVIGAFEEHELKLENARLARLTQAQNDALQELNKELEARVAERTSLLERAKRDWESTFDSIVDPVSIIDLDYRVRRSNRAYAQHAGMNVNRVPGQSCYEALTREQAVCKGCPVDRALSSRQAATGEVLDRNVDRTFQVWAFPIVDTEDQIRNLVCYYRDVTEEKELQQKLVQTEKMAAVGQLAGGVAHEINNPLGGILAFTQLLMREFNEEDEKYSFLAEIEDSALRCKRIVENLLKFSRRSPGTERSLVNLNEVLSSTLFLVAYQFQLKGVEISQELEEELWSVKANGNQLGQVVLNLVTNAIGAMGRGGTLTVRTWNDADAEAVCLAVRDTGSGIAPKHLAKIFEPFFTTKEEGTGLGLTITFDIVQAHGGNIHVDSSEGQGTTFTVTLPAQRGGRAQDSVAPKEGS